MKLNAQELRQVDEAEISESLQNIKRRPIYFILENIYDTYNIGGLFRLADALCIEKMYLCGETEIPPNPKIKKASIGTYKVVPWEYKKSAEDAIVELRALFSQKSSLRQDYGGQAEVRSSKSNTSISIIAVEQDTRSIPYTKVEYTEPLALIVGNETYGVLPETLELVDKIVEIPMWGINKSLNVIVSAAIVSYHAVTCTKPS